MDFGLNIAGYWPHDTPNICMVAWNNDRIQTLYKLGGCLAILFGINLPDMGAVPSQILLQHVYFGPFYVCTIVPRPITPPILADIAIIIGVFCSYEYIEGIWVFKLWTNSIFWCCDSLFLNATFGHGNMNCWPKCNVCVLEAKIWYLWGNMTIGPPPMGIYWMGEWFFGVPYRFYNLRRSYLYYNS